MHGQIKICINGDDPVKIEELTALGGIGVSPDSWRNTVWTVDWVATNSSEMKTILCDIAKLLEKKITK